MSFLDLYFFFNNSYTSFISTFLPLFTHFAIKHEVYIAIWIDIEGHKDVLGMYVGQNESEKFWLLILNGLKNRSVGDILIACVDGLTGFPQAIEVFFQILKSSSVASIKSGIQQNLFPTRNSNR